MRPLYDPEHPSTRFWRAIALALIALLFIWIGPAEAADKRPTDGRCEWLHPAGDPYTGALPAAVARLTAIPAATRAKLAARLADPAKHRKADDVISITRDYVTGQQGDYQLMDMNHGTGSVCWGEVTRESWAQGHLEAGLVFCEDGYCVAWKAVCRNVSRAVRQPQRQRLLTEIPGGRMLMDAPSLMDDSWGAMKALSWVSPVVGAGPSPGVPGGSGQDDGGHSFAGSSYTPWSSWSPPSFLPGRPTEAPPRAAEPPSAPPAAGTPEAPWTPPVPVVPDKPWDPVIPVPEPSTYALMGLGLGLVAWMARRRRTGPTP